MTVTTTSWRGALPRAVLLAVITTLIPLPALAADSSKAAGDRPIAASMERMVARDLSAVPAASTAARPARLRAQTSGQSETFFKTKPGVIALAVMIAGSGYALYSSKHDRITSAGKK